jgi:hypothetical protein
MWILVYSFIVIIKKYCIEITHPSVMKSTLIRMLLGIGNFVISFICLVEQSKSMYRLWMVISKLSHVFEPSPQGVRRQQIRRRLLGNLMGPLIDTPAPPNFLVFSTKVFVTICISYSRFPENIILTFFSSSLCYTSFLVSLSAIILIF